MILQCLCLSILCKFEIKILKLSHKKHIWKFHVYNDGHFVFASLWPDDTIWRRRSWSLLPSGNKPLPEPKLTNQNEVLWHAPGDNFTGMFNILVIYLTIYQYKDNVVSPMGQCVNALSVYCTTNQPVIRPGYWPRPYQYTVIITMTS